MAVVCSAYKGHLHHPPPTERLKKPAEEGTERTQEVEGRGERAKCCLLEHEHVLGLVRAHP